MGLLSTIKFRFDRVGTLKALLDKWRPRNCTTEKAYENSLTTFLRRELPEDTKITPQYAQGRFHADLVIDDRLVVEIKYNLDTTAKYQRLVGQIATYKDRKGQVILLLTGKTDLDLKKELTSYLKKEGLRDSLILMQEDKVFVFEK